MTALGPPLREVQPQAKRTEHGQVGVDARSFEGDEEQAAEVVSHGLRARVMPQG